MAENKPRDIVGRLHSRQMLSYIAQEIMKMLGYQDLVSAQQVSPLWREIVVDNKLWKKLLNRLVAEKQEWKEMAMVLQIEKTISSAVADVEEGSGSLLYENACHLIHQSIKNVDDNWKTGKCAIEEFPLDLDYYSSSLTSTRLVRINDANRCCEIYNRWSLELVKKIFYPENWVSNQSMYLAFNNNKLITCSRFLAVGDIIVWDLESGDEMCRFKDEAPLDWEELEVIYEVKMYSKVCISPDEGRYVASLLSRDDLDTEHTVRSLLTLREILPTGEIVMGTESIDLGSNFEVIKLYVDENFVVLFGGSREEPEEENNLQPCIQIRSTQDLSLVRTLRIFYRVEPSMFNSYGSIVQDYSNGLLIEDYTPVWASQHAQMQLPQGYHLKIWDVATGLCVIKIPLTFTNGWARLISARGKHFVVAFEYSEDFINYECRLMKVWDITEAISRYSASSESTVCHLSSPTWSIRLGGRLGIDYIRLRCIRSISNEYQMPFYGIIGDERKIIALNFFRVETAGED